MIYVYSDGSSTGRKDRPGGWAYVIVDDKGQVYQANYGGCMRTTNNIMELTAAMKGLKAAHALGLHTIDKIQLVSDSQYVLKLAKAECVPSKNVFLAKQVLQLAGMTDCDFRWVKGHSKEPWNDRVDRLAKKGKEEWISKEKIFKASKIE